MSSPESVSFATFPGAIRHRRLPKRRVGASLYAYVGITYPGRTYGYDGVRYAVVTYCDVTYTYEAVTYTRVSYHGVTYDTVTLLKRNLHLRSSNLRLRR